MSKMKRRIIEDAKIHWTRWLNFEITGNGISGPEMDDYSAEVKANLPRTTFTIGWMDLLIRGKLTLNYYTIETERYYEDNEQKKREIKKSLQDTLNFKIVIEIKPNLDDIGAVIRQVKTYRDGLQNSQIFKIFCLIVTYSAPPKEVIKFLEHEGISVLTFPSVGAKETEVIDDSCDESEDPFLMK